MELPGRSERSATVVYSLLCEKSGSELQEETNDSAL